MPGYQDNELVPYRRPAASELHRARQVAVRRSAAGLAPLGGGRGSGTAAAAVSAREAAEPAAGACSTIYEGNQTQRLVLSLSALAVRWIRTFGSCRGWWGHQLPSTAALLARQTVL